MPSIRPFKGKKTSGKSNAFWRHIQALRKQKPKFDIKVIHSKQRQKTFALRKVRNMEPLPGPVECLSPAGGQSFNRFEQSERGQLYPKETLLTAATECSYSDRVSLTSFPSKAYHADDSELKFTPKVSECKFEKERRNGTHDLREAGKWTDSDCTGKKEVALQDKLGKTETWDSNRVSGVDKASEDPRLSSKRCCDSRRDRLSLQGRFPSTRRMNPSEPILIPVHHTVHPSKTKIVTKEDLRSQNRDEPHSKTTRSPLENSPNLFKMQVASQSTENNVTTLLKGKERPLYNEGIPFLLATSHQRFSSKRTLQRRSPPSLSQHKTTGELPPPTTDILFLLPELVLYTLHATNNHPNYRRKTNSPKANSLPRSKSFHTLKKSKSKSIKRLLCSGKHLRKFFPDNHHISGKPYIKSST